ncbi:Ift140 [Symbiodinium natans]|uniref:Ift140 protein n=1 Tax=Symbiodinium natans TaxID=878477 RepID=A0A812N8E3_9DINO|nr:Ift140 [Symbiodinium natans]
MSSIFFDNHLPLSDASSVRCIAWSWGEDSPLLAVAEGSNLRIFREEGEELQDFCQTRPVQCTALAWHPHSKVLAAGWEDGAVTFSGPACSSARDDREVHRDSRIMSIVFNPHGSRCVTTDNNGVVGVWKTDMRGLCNQMCHYRKTGAHDKVIFRTMTPSGEPNLDNPPFFFGGEQGIIYLADDFGLCSERYKIGSPLLLLEYYREKDVVVLVTTSVILVQFSLSADGKVSNESKLKLSCGPSPEKLQGCWARSLRDAAHQDAPSKAADDAAVTVVTDDDLQLAVPAYPDHAHDWEETISEGDEVGKARYFPGNLDETPSRTGYLTERSDRFSMLSVAGDAAMPESLPLLLVLFASLIAALLGALVAGLHTMIKYVGCPLGTNGCNSFSGYEYAKKGFLLVNAMDGYIPEAGVNVLMAMTCMLAIGVIVEVLPEKSGLGKQVLGGGTVQSLLAVAAGIPIAFRCALLRVVITALYFAGGGTMGGDGPTIQVCTAVAGMIGWLCGIRAPRTQSLLASLGFCCGFAASFNAPLSGILFAMEELSHVSSRLTTRVMCIILVGSIISTAVMRGFLENKVLFKAVYPDNLEDMVAGGSIETIFGKSMWMLVSIAIGLLCALIGYVFHKGFALTHWLLTKKVYECCPRYLVFMTLGGMTAGIGAVVFHLTGLRGVWGIGIKDLGEVLVQNPDIEATDLLIFALGKLAAFMLGVAARFPGDTLEPVLIAGGFMGGFVGKILPASMLGPEANAACEIFGMVGLFASCFRFPLTPVVIVLELTGTRTYNIILPVALSSFTALAVSNHLFPPILEQILHQDGIDLEAVAELAEFADDEELSMRDFEERSDSHSHSYSEKPVEGEASQDGSHFETRRTDSIDSNGAPRGTPSTFQVFMGRLEESMFDVSSHDRTDRTRRFSVSEPFAGGRGGSAHLSNGHLPLMKHLSTGGGYGRGIRRFSMTSSMRSEDVHMLDRRYSHSSNASSRRRPSHGGSSVHGHFDRRHSGRRNSHRRTSERARSPSGRRHSGRSPNGHEHLDGARPGLLATPGPVLPPPDKAAHDKADAHVEEDEAGPGLLATCSHESIVRLWNLADDENYILSLQGIDERNSLSGDKVTSIDYNPRKQVLACGTRGGRMVQWRCCTLSGTPKSEANWQVLPVISASDCTIDKLTWGPGESLVHVRTDRNSVILSEAQLNTAFQAPIMAVQTAPAEIMIYHTEKQMQIGLSSPFRVKGVSVGGSTILLWNSKQIMLYDIDVTMQASVLSQFTRSYDIVAAVLFCQSHDRVVAMASGSKIEFANKQGHVQKTIQFSEEVEGLPTCLDVCGDFLVASTSLNFIKVWKVSQDKPKPVGAPRKFEGLEERSLGEIRSVRINKTGTRVSMLVDQRLGANGQPAEGGALRVPDGRMFVYDTESDNFLTYNVGKSCVPVAHFWDSSDARLLCCEVVPQALAYDGQAQPPSPTAAEKEDESKNQPQHCAMTLFVANSEQILLQDSIPCVDPDNHSVTQMPVALMVPHVYFARQGEAAVTEGAEEPSSLISRTVLRDFAGLENMDEETTAALLNFSYHLACGNTDEAYKSVKGVRSTGVWESMSKMCVKTGRLDVAQKCLGQMGHARAAGALRACLEQETEARLAIVAVHLDMVDDAEQLLKKCGRFDLLNQLYQACGSWEKALEIAKTKDRIHLKPTHYAYAQHCEAVEDVQGALTHYELSGTYRTESPRLLCSMGMTEDLGSYVEQSDDSQLHRWYAQYLESKADLDGASREYKKAGDWLSLCRVACFNEDLESAQRICEDSQDQAACYHLARHLEAGGNFKEAIHFFQMAGRVGHALRLAQENNFDGDLMSLALSADPQSMAQAAKYYEQRGQPQKAVILYQKAGQQKRALELCFSARLFDALRKIADDLSAESDPAILAKCAEFFMQHEQHDKAVHLLSISKQYDRAVQLCTEHDVHITEDMAERMTPDKGSMDATSRSEILQDIGKLCKKQGSFQLACKKFTQAGDKLKAMKSLLNSGDTEKIIFFAGTARQPDIYVLAGNYLQSLDWHADPDIMKNIIQFYSKAKAYDKLASFYDACAQVEVDEYRDYEKAGGALREALKYMAKAAGDTAESDERVISLQNRIALVDEFANVRKMAKTEPDQMVAVCERMVTLPDIDAAVRIGDIFAQLVEYYVEFNDYNSAYRTVERMRERGIVLTPYLDRALLERIYGAVGQPLPESEAAPAAPAGEDVDEEIAEED